MVTVLGDQGYLGSVVRRRWLERGDTDHLVNCIRPDDPELSEALAKYGRFIQPSTDAIAESSDYAATKRRLEQIPGAVTIRAGIVDVRQQYPIAYRNWRYNPLTPLEWADYAYDHRDEPGLHVTGREPRSRYDVALLVSVVFQRPYPQAGWAEVPLARTQTIDHWPSLYHALIEYREWLRS